MTRVITVLIIVLLTAACRQRGIKSASAGSVRVRVVQLTTGPVSMPVHTSGTLEAAEELKLSFKTGGIVSRILVRDGDRVRKGDLLASLDLVEINANAEQARIGYDKALRDFQRAENLLGDGALSLEKKQNAETAMNIAKNSLEIAQFNLRHSRIEAPDDGIIMKKFVKENELVSSGYPVFLFGTSGKYWKITAGLSDRDLIRINPGDSAEVIFDVYPGIKFAARVDQVGEMSDPYTGTYKAELRLRDAGFRLASGFIASVAIIPAVKKSFNLVPVESVVEADGKQGFIYIVSNATTARKIRVEIVALTGTMAAVKGIPEGVKEIVSEGAAYLHDGAVVEIVR